MKDKQHRPELLAPAGSFSSAIAAFNAGADAVYAGFSSFNARERAENFSYDEMLKLREYVQKNNKKLYITLNTLIKESELENIFSLIQKINEISPHAVIVQDLGIINILRRFFPNLKIHASTQMGIHNSPGIKTARKLGISRVILERQISLKNLRRIVSQSPLETEIFIHGALCCSLSGQCLISSWIGGHSGNRGKCKQPCRQRFFHDKGNGFFFSTQDLYTLDLIPQLMDTGIESFKIEGRLKNDDYVSNVVSAYRKMMDCSENNFRRVLGQSKKILSDAGGRHWSHGFLSRKSTEELIQFSSIGSSGKLCGRIIEKQKNGFSVQTMKKISLYDRIRVQKHSGENGTSFTVTKISSQSGQNLKSASEENKIFIHCDKKDIPEKGKVYKIGVKPEKTDIEIRNLKKFRTRINLKIIISLDFIKISSDKIRSFWQKKLKLEKAEKFSPSEKQISSEFSISNSAKFSAGKIHVEFKGYPFLPASVLKKLRKEFWKWINCNAPEEYKHFKKKQKNEFKTYLRKYQKCANTDNTISVHSEKKLKNLTFNNYEQVNFPQNSNQKTEQVILPAFTAENDIKKLENIIQSAISKGIKKFRISSLWQFALFENINKVTLVSNYPLPTSNSIAVRELFRTFKNLKTAQAWIELENSEIKKMSENSPVPVEIYKFGRPSLLASTARIPAENQISDSRKNKFLIKFSGNKKLTKVYPEKIFKNNKNFSAPEFYDLTNADLKNRKTYSFNTDFEWK